MEQIKIEQCQEICFESMFYYRGIIDIKDVGCLNKQIQDFLFKNNISLSPVSISSIKNAEVFMSMGEIEYEYLMPVEKSFKDTEQFKYINKFKLENIIKCSYKGVKISNDDLSRILNAYISEHGLEVASGAYYLINENDMDFENMSIEIYLKVKELSE